MIAGDFLAERPLILRDLKSLYSPKAERIIRVLLCNPGKNWKVKELADESGVSLGQASNVKKILQDQELLSGKRGELSLEQPVSLLQEWAENYDFRKNRIQEFYSFKSVTNHSCCSIYKSHGLR